MLKSGVVIGHEMSVLETGRCKESRLLFKLGMPAPTTKAFFSFQTTNEPCLVLVHVHVSAMLDG